MARWRWLEQVTDQEQLLRLKLLGTVPLFAYLPGETIFMEGEPGKALFIILAGRVSICRALNEGEELLATLTTGGYFGELALIDDQPRFASARAKEASRLLILYRSDFEDLMEGQRALAIQVMGNLLKTLAGYVRRAQSQRNGRNSMMVGQTPATDKPGMASKNVSHD